MIPTPPNVKPLDVFLKEKRIDAKVLVKILQNGQDGKKAVVIKEQNTVSKENQICQINKQIVIGGILDLKITVDKTNTQH